MTKQNGKRMQYRPLIVYFIIWLISYAVFFMTDPGDAMGYWIVAFWGVLPIAAIISSIFLGQNKTLNSKALIPIGVYYGVMYMMVPYLTFKMANYHAQIAAVRNGLPMPDIKLFFVGVLFFIAGYAIGRVIDKVRSKWL